MAFAGGGVVKVVSLGRYVGRIATSEARSKEEPILPARPCGVSFDITADEIAAREADAYARGLADGRMAALSEHAVAVEIAPDPESARMADEASARIVQGFEKIEEMTHREMLVFQTAVSASVVSILKSYILETECRKIADSLVEHLNKALRSGDFTRVKVKAPEAVLSSLLPRMSEWRVDYDLEQSEGVDVSISFGDLRIETHLAQWAQLLNSACGAE